jgi:hypothetical protein
MSTMAKDDPIAVDDQDLFFRQIVDLSPVELTYDGSLAYSNTSQCKRPAHFSKAVLLNSNPTKGRTSRLQTDL